MHIITLLFWAIIHFFKTRPGPGTKLWVRVRVQSCGSGSGSMSKANLSSICSGVWQYILYSLVPQVVMISISQARNCDNTEFKIIFQDFYL